MGCFVYGDVLVSAVLIYDELYMSLSDAIVLEDFFKQRKITLVRWIMREYLTLHLDAN
jgi:hypothetical protein